LVARSAQKIAALIAGIGIATVVVLVMPRPTIDQGTSPPQAREDSERESPLTVPEIPVSTSPVVAEQLGLVEPAGVAKPLQLFAVYPGLESKVGRAVLGAAEASSRTYVTGALLENGAKLVEVFDDRAVLAREDRSYTLYLPNRGTSDTLDPRASELTVGGFEPPQPDLPPSGPRVSDVLRLVPSYNGEAIVGFSVYPGAQRGPFDASGLQSGDVLVSAGGFPLNDVTQMEAVSERLAAGATLVADVLRGSGERRQVTLNGSALFAASAASMPAPPPIQ
jgi:hypothetical protein